MDNEKYIIDYIRKYIKNSVNSAAVMIDGDWGSGKTFFIKEVLAKELKPDLKNMKKNICYITLNGISTIDEFIRRYQIELIKIGLIEKKRGKKDDYGVMDIITGFDALVPDYHAKAYSNIIKGLAKGTSQYLANKYTESTIFIFDDLERCKIDIEEILGSINDLIEHKNSKVIIVANDKEIKKEKSYQKIKEKFISRTLKYSCNLDSFFVYLKKQYKDLYELDNILWDDFKGIIKNKKCMNLRTILSAFSIMDEVHSIIYNDIKKENMEIIIYCYNYLFKDIVTAEIWYKAGRNRPEKRHDSIRGMYILEDYEYLFDFIVDIIFEGIYDENNIRKEIMNFIKFNKYEGSLSPIVKLKTYAELEDNEILAEFDNLINILLKNKFSISCYPEIIRIAISLYDLGYKPHNLTTYDEFENVLEKNVDNLDVFSYESDLSYDLSEGRMNDENNAKYKRTLNNIINKIYSVRKKVLETKISHILKKNNWAQILLEDMQENSNIYRRVHGYICFFDLDNLINRIKKATNKELLELRDTFYDLYRRNNAIYNFEKDCQTAQEFIERLNGLCIDGIINKKTLSYIKGDFVESFSQKNNEIKQVPQQED